VPVVLSSNYSGGEHSVLSTRKAGDLDRYDLEVVKCITG
jgi:hypothetical protein